FGSVINEAMEDEVVVTVIATGFDIKAVQQTVRLDERPARRAMNVSAPAAGGDIAEYAMGEEKILGKASNVRAFMDRTVDKPAYLRKVAGFDFRNEALGIDDDDELDVPTFLRRQAD
ncbi:MAG TPA: hypothetical protein VJM83_04590, partial [Nitrospirota bacterium]|nr:hypothetical protein [Nitrospirota bacterium]